MSDACIRPWKTEDLPWLEQLWEQAFGDEKDYIQAFHRFFLHPGSCLVAEADGRAVSAMYILEGPILFPPDGNSLSTAYVYALSTDSAYRGQGIGTAVYRACVEKALQTVDAACVLPSDSDLYSFYINATGAVPVSWAREATLSREALIAPAHKAVLISPGEYYLRRKSLLRGHPYAVNTTSFLSWESYHEKYFGGGFLAIDGDVAAVEMDGSTCRILELITPEGDWQQSLAAVAALFPAEQYQLRCPIFFPGPDAIRPFMLATLGPAVPDKSAEGLWWGYAFD